MVAGKFTIEQNDTVTMAIEQMGTSTIWSRRWWRRWKFLCLNGVPKLIAGGGGGHGGIKIP